MKYRVAILGHQQITRFVLEYFLENNVKIDCVIGMQEDREIVDYFDIKCFCEKTKLSYFCPEQYSLKSEKDIGFFAKSNFDFLFVVGWSRLVPKDVLSTINKSSIGWHGGMYKPPRCRGRAVVNWALIKGMKKFYVYAMSLNEGVDSGDIFIIHHTYLNLFDDSQSAYFKMSIIVSEMYLNIVKNFKELTPRPQSKSKPSYLPKRAPENSGISWSKSTDEIYNFVRALNDPFPNAFTYFKNNIVYIRRIMPFMKKCELEVNMEYGKIYHVFHDKSFTVGCLDGLLLVRQFESNPIFHPVPGMHFNVDSGINLDCKNY